MARESDIRRRGRSCWRSLYGATDEYHQSFVPGRTMSVSDLMVDLIGAGAALLIVTLLRARRMGLRPDRRVS